MNRVDTPRSEESDSRQCSGRHKSAGITVTRTARTRASMETLCLDERRESGGCVLGMGWMLEVSG